MKVFIRIWSVLVCICFLLILAGCNQSPTDPITAPTTVQTEPLLPPWEKYDLARKNLEQASNQILTYTLEEQRTVGKDTYTRTATGTASYSALYKADMMAVVQEQLNYGGYSAEYMEVYCEGMAYSQVNESYFKAEMDPGTFVLRQLPAVLIDSSLYQSITESADEDGTVITFSNATALEPWVGKSNAKLVSAAGTASLDSSGALLETTCRITYTVGSVQYRVSATVRGAIPASLDLSGTHKEHIKGSTRIKDLDAPKMLLQVVGDVYAAGKMQCSTVESIYSEAVRVAYSQRSEINVIGSGENLYARAEYEMHTSDDRGNISTKSQVDLFENGVFSSTLNQGDPVNNPEVTAVQMRRYSEDSILSALAAPKYLKKAYLTNTTNNIRVDFEGNYDFVMDMMANISQFLQVDLEDKSTERKTVSAGGYLVINRETGLPTAMGLHMERQHTIDTVTYRVTYQLEQITKLSDYE